jgi:hypothetical protein
MFSVFGTGLLIPTFLNEQHTSSLSMFSLVFVMGLLILTFFGLTTQVTSLGFLLSLAWDSWTLSPNRCDLVRHVVAWLYQEHRFHSFNVELRIL